MSNYRRLISYIYAYEGGIKGKNVGFAKLEVRNGQCKIQVNVRNVFIGSQDTGVYLLSGSDEILIGKIFIRNGAGEFRAMAAVNNVAGSGKAIDQCYGLTVHNLADSWQSYTTIWEDAVAHAAEVVLEDATSERIERNKAKEEEQGQNIKGNGSVSRAIEAEIEAQSRLEEQKLQRQTALTSVIPPPDQEMADLGAMELKPMEVKPIAGVRNENMVHETEENGSVKEEEKTEDSGDQEMALDRETGSEPGAESEPNAQVQQEEETRSQSGPEQKPEGEQEETEGQNESITQTPVIGAPDTRLQESGENKESDQLQGSADRRMTQNRSSRPGLFGLPGWFGQPGGQPGRQTQTNQTQTNQMQTNQPQTAANQFQTPPAPTPFRPYRTGTNEIQTDLPQSVQQTVNPSGPAQPQTDLPQPDQQPPELFQPQLQPSTPDQSLMEEEPKIEAIWQQFFNRYPKIQAFDYNGGCEILTIKPQDIGLLPREVWSYGNNSFLLHGYYSHRYIIFARLGNPKGKPRYLLGVPGHYYSNEKYMASMFGFPNFVLSKMQPAGDGRFGYWYTDIRMGN